MLGELPPEPVGLLARQMAATRSVPAPFDIDISESRKLYLIVEDALSTAPDKGRAPVDRTELPGRTALSALVRSRLSALRGCGRTPRR